MKNNFFLVRELPNETTLASGIYITEKYSRKATVLACSESENEIQVGDIVIRNVGRGTQITINDENLEMIHRDFIMAIIG